MSPVSQPARSALDLRIPDASEIAEALKRGMTELQLMQVINGGFEISEKPVGPDRNRKPRLAVVPDAPLDPDSYEAFCSIVSDFSADKYHGKESVPQKWRVSGLVPDSALALFPAREGTGKGMLSVDLAIKLAGRSDAELTWLGQPILDRGPVVYLAAEEDRNQVHRRIAALTGGDMRILDRLSIIPMPSINGTRLPFASRRLFEKDGTPKSLVKNAFRLMQEKRGSLLIVDPISAILGVSMTDADAIYDAMSYLNSNAAETGCGVLCNAHTNKSEAGDDAGARSAIKDSQALQGASRVVIYLRSATTGEASGPAKKHGCSSENILTARVIKTNLENTDRAMKFIKFVPGSPPVFISDTQSTNDISDVLRSAQAAIDFYADSGEPISATGPNGLHAKRDELLNRWPALEALRADNTPKGQTRSPLCASSVIAALMADGVVVRDKAGKLFSTASAPKQDAPGVKIAKHVIARKQSNRAPINKGTRK